MLSRVIAKNVGDVFFETQCSEVRIAIFARYERFGNLFALFDNFQGICCFFPVACPFQNIPRKFIRSILRFSEKNNKATGGGKYYIFGLESSHFDLILLVISAHVFYRFLSVNAFSLFSGVVFGPTMMN